MVYTRGLNRFFTTPLGRRQVVRHKTLDLVSQVRILAPQPEKQFTVHSSQFMDEKIKLISGNSNRALVQKISDYLKISLCDAEIKRFLIARNSRYHGTNG